MLVRGGYVITMDPGTGDIPCGDVPVTGAQPGNVDTLIADGRALKRGGVLTTLDAERIGGDARRALDAVIARPGPATR